MKKAAKKKQAAGRATKARKSTPRKPAAGKSHPPASRPAARNTSRAPSKRRREPRNPAADLARSALEAFDAGQLDKARRDIMSLSEMLSNG